jgi:hypothetical protein
MVSNERGAPEICAALLDVVVRAGRRTAGWVAKTIGSPTIGPAERSREDAMWSELCAAARARAAAGLHISAGGDVVT